jgi:hypothetical protein
MLSQIRNHSEYPSQRRGHDWETTSRVKSHQHGFQDGPAWKMGDGNAEAYKNYLENKIVTSVSNLLYTNEH